MRCLAHEEEGGHTAQVRAHTCGSCLVKHALYVQTMHGNARIGPHALRSESTAAVPAVQYAGFPGVYRAGQGDMVPGGTADVQTADLTALQRKMAGEA